jgi:hypothetical protein
MRTLRERLDDLGQRDMTGYRSKDLRHNCVLHGCMQDREPDWEWMRGAFPRGIMPTDADGVVEVMGEVLILEEKGVGGSFDDGQLQAFKALGRFRGMTVLTMRLVDDPAVREVLIHDGKKAQGWHLRSLDQLRDYFAAWADTADRKLLR